MKKLKKKIVYKTKISDIYKKKKRFFKVWHHFDMT